jgi:hypothetical protein
MARRSRARTLRFDVYGRFQLEVARGAGAWIVHRVTEGRRRRAPDIVIPPDLEERAIPRYLDDLLHELAGPGASITARPDDRSRAPIAPRAARSRGSRRG